MGTELANRGIPDTEREWTYNCQIFHRKCTMYFVQIQCTMAKHNANLVCYPTKKILAFRTFGMEHKKGSGLTNVFHGRSSSGFVHWPSSEHKGNRIVTNSWCSFFLSCCMVWYAYPMQSFRPGSTAGDRARRAGLTTRLRTPVIVQAWALMFTQAPCVSLPSANFYPFTFLNKC